MKNIIFIVLFCWLTRADAQRTDFNFWTLGTAKTIEARHREIGVFSPYRYGLSEKLELITDLQTFLAVPNVALKKEWGSFKDERILLTSKHGAYYPVPAFTINQKTGYGGEIFPKDYKIPSSLFGIVNELLMSKILTPKTSCAPPNNLLTLKLGLQLGVGSLDTSIVINKKLLYHRSEVFHGKPLWYVGADLQSHWDETWDYSIDAAFYSSGLATEHWAVEHKLLLIYPLDDNIRFMFGYKFSYGSYPNNSKGLLLVPLVDLIWHFVPKKGVERGLFNEQMF